MLDQAKAQLLEIMETLHEDIEAGVPIVGLEPACVAVFRDELLNLFPHNPLAQKLSRQVYLFSEFIVEQTNLEIKPLNRKAVVHGHCHHKAVMGMNSENQLMKKLGLDIKTPESGCCGMSGSFGFKPEHYDLSMKIGEKSLLPSVRDAEEEMLVIADGYSCREQIEQGAGKRALHVAEVTRSALR
jgi:Fe-S oxidoreductase